MSRKQKKRTNDGNWPNFSGQHLMRDKRLIREIVAHANIGPDELAIDLGAGRGALTAALIEKARKTIAVEYDRKFVKWLKQKWGDDSRLQIIHQDILNLRLPNEPFVVVSNIPYAITTPIMKMLLNRPASGFQRGVIVMEKGAAKRFTSSFVKDPYVLVWRMWFDLRYVKQISRHHFSPPPSVDSAMVTIRRKQQPLAPFSADRIVWGLADYALKRPQAPIDVALKGVFTSPQMKHIKQNLRIADDVPVGALSERQWAGVLETMTRHVPSYRWPKMKKGKRR